MRIIDWLMRTLLIGCIPLIARFIVWILISAKNVGFVFNPVDIVFLGLSLNLNNLNELHNDNVIKNTKSFKYHQGFSIILTVTFSLILSVLYVSEILNIQIIKNYFIWCTSVCCLSSAYLSISILYKQKTENKNIEK